MQLILRRCGSGVAGRMAGLEDILMGVSYLHPIFFGGFFGDCNLLDFAVLRMRCWSSRSNLRSGVAECVERNAARSSAWQALH